MQLTTARKIASKGVVAPAEFSLYQSAKAEIRKARKRRRSAQRRNRK